MKKNVLKQWWVCSQTVRCRAYVTWWLEVGGTFLWVAQCRVVVVIGPLMAQGRNELVAENWAHVPVACPEHAKISSMTTNVIAQIRFANELGRRDYVTGEMWKNNPPIRLFLNEAGSTEIIWHEEKTLTVLWQCSVR